MNKFEDAVDKKKYWKNGQQNYSHKVVNIR